MKMAYGRMQMWKSIVAMAAAVAMVSACTPDEDEVVKSPLPVFEARFDPKPVWEASVTTTFTENVVVDSEAFWRGFWPWSKPQTKDDRPAFARVPADLTPVWYNDTLYVVSKEGLLMALDANGNTKFRRWLGTPISGGIATASNHLYLGTPDGEVLSLKSEDGEEEWRNVVSSEVIAAPAIADSIVVVRCVDGKLFALNQDSGERKWFADRNVPNLTQRGTSAPTIVGGMVIAGFDNGKVSAFRLSDGKELWEKRVSQPTGRSEIDRIADIDADPLVFGSNLYVASFNGSIMAIDLRTGEPAWQREISTYRSMSVDATMLYATTANGDVLALDRRNGFVLWSQKALENRYLTAPSAFMDYVVVGDGDGFLHFLDRTDGHFVAGVLIDRRGFQSAPVVLHDQLMIYGRSNVLRAYGSPELREGRIYLPYPNAEKHTQFWGPNKNLTPHGV